MRAKKDTDCFQREQLVMKSELLILLIVLTECPFLALGSLTNATGTLYPYGPSRGDLVQLQGDDWTYSVIETETTFWFYDKPYQEIYIMPNGLISFGNPFATSTPSTSPRNKAYAAAFWMDIILTNLLGRIYYRQVNLMEENDIVAMIERDTMAAGERMTPELAAVITWDKVAGYELENGEQNTFQVVLASNGNKTFIVFNYGEIDWIGPQGDDFGGLRFDSGEGTWAKYPIDMTPELINITHYSTVGIPGRIVTRVDTIDVLPALIEVIRPSTGHCTIDGNTSTIVTFDGSTDVFTSESNRKYLISKLNDKVDPCKYMLRISTDQKGDIDWVGFSVGVHTKNPNKYQRNFAFGRHVDTVMERRPCDKAVISDFPYWVAIEYNGDLVNVKVDHTTEGWIVRSLACPYEMEYSPKTDAPQLRLSVGERYKGRTIGICQNFNDDAADDNKDCRSPPQIADLRAIGESCSCPVTDKTCNKALLTL